MAATGGPPDGTGMRPPAAGSDAGMVALAVPMLAPGLVMIARGGTGGVS